MKRERMTQQTHRLGELEFRSRTSPSRSGAVFVLVHGIGMSHRYLARLHRALHAHGTVISMDLPGFGGLPKPPRDLDVPQMADGIARVIEDLGIGPVVLVGHSMGTQWVIESAVRRPDLARAVVAIGPVTDDRARTVGKQAAALALDMLREPPGANALVLGDYLRCGPGWYLTQLRHMLAYAPKAAADRLTVPLLVMRGSRDPVAPREWCRRLREAAREAVLVEIPGRAHNAQHSAPRAVAAAILHNLAALPDELPESLTSARETGR